MTTIINTPGGGNSEDNSGLGLIVGILLGVLVVILFLIYGLPAIRNRNQTPATTNITVTVPNPVTSTTP